MKSWMKAFFPKAHRETEKRRNKAGKDILRQAELLRKEGKYDELAEFVEQANTSSLPKRLQAKIDCEFGLALRALGRHEEEEAAFRHALRSSPSEARAAVELAKLLRQKGLLREERVLLRDAYRRTPDNIHVALDYARVLRRSRDSAEALKVLEKIRQEGRPPSVIAKVYFERAVGLRDLDRRDEAEEAFLRSLEEDPTATNAAIEAAKLMGDAGRLGEALKMLELGDAERSKPLAENLQLREELYADEGEIKVRSPKKTNAKPGIAAFFSRIYREAEKRRNSRFSKNILRQAELLRKEKKYDEAVGFMEEADISSLSRTLQAKFDREFGLALRALGRHEDAETAFRRALKSAPSETKAAIELAKLLRKKGLLREEMSLLEDAHRQTPDNVHVALDYARCLRRGRDSAEALKVLEKIRQEGRPPSVIAKVYFERAVGLRDLDRRDEAEEAFLRSFEKDASATNAAIELAKLMKDSGRLDEALKILELDDTRHSGRLVANFQLRAALYVEIGDAEGVSAICDRLSKETKLPASVISGQIYEKSNDPEAAVEHFLDAVRAKPNHVPSLLSLGKLHMKLKRPEEALVFFRRLLDVDPKAVEAHHGMGVALRQLTQFEAAERAYLEALRLSPARHGTLLELSDLRYFSGDLNGALHYADLTIEYTSSNIRAFMTRSRIHYEMGDIERSAADCKEALRLSPEHAKAKSQLAIIQAETHAQPSLRKIDVCFLHPLTPGQAEALQGISGIFETIILLGPDDLIDEFGEASDPEAENCHWIKSVSEAVSDHVVIVRCAEDVSYCKDIVKAIGTGVGITSRDETMSVAAWRRDCLLACIALSGVKTYADLLEYALPRLKVRYLGMADIPLVPNKEEEQGDKGEVWLVSTSGIKLFGGVEQFLRSLVPVYKALGYRPLIVGVVEKMDGDSNFGEIDGIQFINIRREINNIRNIIIERNPTIIHATTGIGYDMASAINGLRARLIYGTHFWRDMFHGDGSFENIDINGRFRSEFGVLCACTDQAYANSLYTQTMINKHFGIVQPIMYSLPFDTSEPAVDCFSDAYVLLMNGRPDKGLPILLDAAERLSHIPFLVVASQVSADRVQNSIDERNLKNVGVVGWTDDTEGLYRRARVVLVPSYAFIETFSRVVIEAHRYGVPVIGSDRGNVPLLLEQSGVSLPEDSTLWAEEIGKLFSDDEYWLHRSRLALENSLRYNHAQQENKIDRLVRASLQRIAIGVGSGIGNMIQCSPVIRRIAEYFGAPVDIILRQDFPGCASLFEGSEYVASVIPADSHAMFSRYDAVLMLDCFGLLIPHMNTDRLYVARRQFSFSMTQTMHEAEFYLMCARELLGVPFRKEDVGKYFVGAHQARPAAKRIGVHAGCKGGVWEAKRWPFFFELCNELQRSGYELVSFGVKDEAVPGTVDQTGTDLHETLSGIASCSYFIANDSGLMHVADALDIPLTAIFGPTSVVKNGPLSKNSQIVKVEKSCAPCQFDSEKLSKCTCITELPLESVHARVMEHMLKTVNS